MTAKSKYEQVLQESINWNIYDNSPINYDWDDFHEVLQYERDNNLAPQASALIAIKKLYPLMKSSKWSKNDNSTTTEFCDFVNTCFADIMIKIQNYDIQSVVEFPQYIKQCINGEGFVTQNDGKPYATAKKYPAPPMVSLDLKVNESENNIEIQDFLAADVNIEHETIIDMESNEMKIILAKFFEKPRLTQEELDSIHSLKDIKVFFNAGKDITREDLSYLYQNGVHFSKDEIAYILNLDSLENVSLSNRELQNVTFLYKLMGGYNNWDSKLKYEFTKEWLNTTIKKDKSLTNSKELEDLDYSLN